MTKELVVEMLLRFCVAFTVGAILMLLCESLTGITGVDIIYFALGLGLGQAVVMLLEIAFKGKFK